MFHRILVVGVGGSGGKTLRFIHQELRWKLAEMGWTRDLPVGWQFLQIDVPTVPDGNEDGLPPQLPAVGGQYLGLVQPNVRYRNLDAALVAANASPEILEACVGWRPRPDLVKVDIEKGAGQFRCLGRVVASAGLAAINTALRTAVARLSDPSALGELDRVSRLFGNEASNESPAPLAIIVSSIGGGSGSGIVLDVCDVLRAQGPGWCDSSIAILFTPDIFTDLRDLDRQGVMPNSLAAMSELLAGYWHDEPAGVAEFALLGRAGIQVGAVERRGPRYPFLVGAANNKVTFGRQNDVYAATGKALAAFMTSSAAQSSTVGYLVGQWVSNGTNIDDHSGLRPELGVTPFSSLGFSTVGLGRDRFARYAAERLARSAVEWALRAHWEGRNVPTDVHPDQALDEAETANFEWFLKRAGLDELGEQNNDVIDALRPPDRDARLNAESAAIAQRVKTGRSGGLRPSQWAAIVLDVMKGRDPDFERMERDALESRAAEWAVDIQTKIETAVLEAIGRTGVTVTEALVGRLASYLGEVITDLTQESLKFERWAARRDEGVSGEIAKFGEANPMQENNPLLATAMSRGVRTLHFHAEARLRSLAAELLRDVRDSVVRPLGEAVLLARKRLADEDRPPPGAPESEIRGWPEGDIVPRVFEPAVNERLIEPVDDYPTVFRSYVQRTTDQRAAVSAVRVAVAEILTGRAQPEAQVVERTATWWPRSLSHHQPLAVARYDVHVSADDVLGRARHWVSRPDTAIGSYVHESLRDYLDPSHADCTTRVAQFVEAFSAAVALAAPLVKLSNAMLQQVHGLGGPALNYQFTEIPLNGLPVEKDVLRSLQTMGVVKTAGDEATFRSVVGEGAQQRIDILTFFNAAHEPIVFDSLMRPVADEWARRRTTPDDVKTFWQWRRARPLRSFVPASPRSRRAMVSGWFLARVLGELEWPPEYDGPPLVYLPHLQRMAPLPYPFLGERALSDTDLLPAVLESLPLAIVEANVRQTLDPLAPYRRLRELGQDPIPPLRRWLNLGTTVRSVPPDPRMAGRSDGPADERKVAVLTYLEGRREKYEKYTGTGLDQKNFFDMPRIWELRDDLREAFTDLIHVVSLIDIEDDDKD